MGLLHIYNSFSNKHKTLIKSGKLNDILPDFNFKHAVIIKEGKKIAPDYNVQEDDVIYIRILPAGNSGLSAKDIILGILTYGIYTGIKSYRLSKEAERKSKEAEKNAKNLSQKVTQFPFIKGAGNVSALGNTIQYLMGNCYNTPYKLNEGFYTIGGTDGEKQYYNLILSAGWGPQLIQSLSIGNEKIKDFSDTEPQETVTAFDTSSLYYDSENIIEIAQEHDFQTNFFRQKVIGEYYGDEIKHDSGSEAEPLIKQCAENTMKVEVCIQFNGLRKFTDNSWKSKSIEIIPEWSNDGGTTWEAFTFDRGSNTFTYNSDHTLRFTATKSFSYAECYGKTLSIRLTRITAKESSNSQEDAYLLYINSYCYDNKKSAQGDLVPCVPLESPFKEKTTRIGVRIIANDNTKDILDQINAMCFGIARTWNKVLRVWSETKTTTRNIASWILEILESNTHLPSKISLDEIDTYSFGALYEYCAENYFYCDGIITQGIKKETLLSKLLLLCNADIYINAEGKYAVAIDKKETTPVALLNAQSIRSVSVSKSFERKPDGIKVSFTNRKNWLQDTMYCMRDGGEKHLDDTCTETAIEYATEAEHVYKFCQRRMRQQELQPREITVKVGNEGDYYPLYSTVLLQLEQLRQGLASAVIHSVNRNNDGQIISLEVSDLLNFDFDFSYVDENGMSYVDENGLPYISSLPPDTPYGIIIQAQDETGRRNIAVPVTGSGKSRTLIFLTPLSLDEGPQIQPGNVLSFGFLNEYGEFDRITNKMKITGVASDSEGWTLTLKDYSDEIYEYGVIPEYKSNLTSPVTKILPSEIIGDNAFRARQAASEATQYADVTEALANASAAVTTANTASQNASAAVTTANTASQNASAAVTTANTASQNASAAVTTANTASQNASAAVTTANTASQNASAAVTTANTASQNASNALSLIANLSNDGIISGGMEKSQLYVQWREAVADYLKYKAMASSYYDYADENGNSYVDENGNSYVTVTNLNPLTTAYTALAKILNNNDEPSAAILNGTARPAWLAANAMSSDTSISDVSAYQNAWIAFYTERAEFLNNITVSSKDLADAAQKAANEAFDLSTISLELSRFSLQFCMNSENFTLYNESQTFTAALMQNGEGLEADTVFASSDSSAFSASAVKDGSVITVTVTSLYGSPFSSAKITLTTTYKGVIFSAQCTLTANDVGKYRGIGSSVPSSPSFNDYFTWTGADTASTLVRGGTFYKSQVYRYVGTVNGASYTWVQDNGIQHNADALNDILNILDSTLARQNSYATQYMNVLAANKIFARSIIANQGFIDELMTKNLILKLNGYIKSEGYIWDGNIKGFMLKSDGGIQIQDGDFKGRISAKIFHFDTTAFSILDDGWTDSDGNFHYFQNGDMWFVGA
ncbi:hypothetical protein [uncultured Treponema sp.]|uniref:hypothetical protein n=1 Tax=uncultured Treponema sp. TaxID=162155 RepID=UPI0025F9A5B8|nr:hypothetical protein [uncultured Treponema sp.]